MIQKNLFFLLLLPALSVAQTVYKTPSGAKYHREDCRMVKNKSRALDVADALMINLEPCKICKPESSGSYTISSNGAAAVGRKQQTSQCLGRTKKGSRCKHNTQIANGYCFQHQPRE